MDKKNPKYISIFPEDVAVQSKFYNLNNDLFHRLFIFFIIFVLIIFVKSWQTPIYHKNIKDAKNADVYKTPDPLH